MAWLFWQQVGVLFEFLCNMIPLFFVSILVIVISREFYEEFRPKQWKISLMTLKPLERSSLGISDNATSV
jgi:hypothetical protein